MIMVLAGTNEGRKMAVALEQEGHNVIVSTATTYGGEILRREFSGEISSRPLDLEEMVTLIKSRSISRVVDATHPYAVDVSANAREACRRTNIAYERLERAETELADLSEVIAVTGIQEALSIAASFEGIIFLTVGSSKLELYTAALGTDRLAVRILPLEASLKKCLSLGLPPEKIIAMQGPFDEELNRVLFKHYNASLIISKDSGPTGGTAEKIKAAKSLSIPIILISRPPQ
jgi:precorrin-6A/cobalt-precorrin-6A reductase